MEEAIYFDEDEAQEGDALTLDAIMQAENVADLLDEDELRRIGADVVRDFQIDLNSRKVGGFEERNKRAMDKAMQVQEAKEHPWPGAANVKYPLLTVAAIQFQARAYPAIIDGTNLVKGRVLGPDEGVPAVDQMGQPMPGPDGQPQWQVEPGAKRARADRMARHMTWQLLEKMDDWEEDTDRLLIILPILGCVIRKSYYDALLQTNVSTMLAPEDFVINYWAPSIKKAPRYTHVLRYYPHEVRERVLAGIWRDVRAEPAQDDTRADTSDENAPVLFYEQHRLIDLDDDGCPEPYVVITTAEGDVARVSPCFGPEDIKVTRDGQILRIERNEYFTKYGFIPSPDGSFYDVGFGHLTGSINDMIDTILNQMIDAGSLANSQGGFIGSGTRPKSGNMRFRLGEWKVVENIGGSLRDNIMPLQLPGPSAVLFNLLGFLVEAAKEITSVQDIMTGGDQNQNAPVGTTMARLEQGMKAFSAIFKRIHRAFSRELKILRRLNREYLDEQEYYSLNDTPGVVQRADYEDKDLDVAPVSDPAMASDIQKIARADYLATFTGNPFVDQKKIARRRLEAGNIADVDDLMDVPEPAPDPKLLIEGMKQQLEKIKVDADRAVKQSQAAMNFMAAAEKAAALGIMTDAAKLAANAVEESEEEDRGELTDKQGGVSEMGGASGDDSVPGLPEGGPIEPDGGMGVGPSDGPGAAGAGGPVGPVDEPFA